ncbi:major capsid protein [Polaromonas aquatica]|uniref:major capsid protein n=1 Tax=Polaromonas aquatica TaxID=332657 RepID=UPI003D65A3F8
MKRSLKLKLASIPAFVLASSGAAYAAVPAAVTTAMTDAQADALSVAGTLTAMVALIWGAVYLKRKFFG